MTSKTYLVTGASGQLGRLVIDHLKTLVPADSIIALVRSEEAKAAYAEKGIATRYGDYSDKASLVAAFENVDRVLLISSSEIGQREPQHQNVIDAAKEAGVEFIAYTSLLGADKAKMKLAEEHRETEAALKASGLPHAFLRNGWYSENLVMSLPTNLELGQHFGAAQSGKISAASRQDFAEAAAVVLATEGHAGKTYELAGDNGFSLADYAAEVSQASGKAVSYTDMPEAAFAQALVGAGLPEGFAAILADSDARAAEGELYSESADLANLIGRPTTAIGDTIRAALAA